LDGVRGEHLTIPDFKTKTHLYVAITSSAVHFVDMQGVSPGVCSIPLKDIEQVEAEGPVAQKFFADPVVNRNAARFRLTCRKEFRADTMDSEADPNHRSLKAQRSVSDPGMHGMEKTSRGTDATTSASAGMSMFGRMVYKMKAMSSSSSCFNNGQGPDGKKRSAAAADVAPPPPTPPPPRRSRDNSTGSRHWVDNVRLGGTRGSAGAVTEGWSGAGPVTEAAVGAVAGRLPPLTLGPVKDAVAAVMMATAGAGAEMEAGMNHSLSARPSLRDAHNGSGSHFDVSAAMQSARTSSIRSVGEGGGGLACRGSTSTSGSPREAHYVYEYVSVVTFEVGSQVAFQLECAMVRLHAQRAVRVAAAAASAASNPNTPHHSPAQMNSLAGYVPRELLRLPAAAASVSAATSANDVTSVSALTIASGMVDHARATLRHCNGRCTFDAALALPPPPPQQLYSTYSLNQPVMSRELPVRSFTDHADEHRSVAAGKDVEERARLGLVLAAPLGPAIAVAVAVLETVRLHEWSEEYGTRNPRWGPSQRQLDLNLKSAPARYTISQQRKTLRSQQMR
jgi:hypothetical protein